MKTYAFETPPELVARIRADEIPQGKTYLDVRDATRKGPPNPNMARKIPPKRKEGPTEPLKELG